MGDGQRCSGEPPVSQTPTPTTKTPGRLTIFKIRNPHGLYSTGGTSPRWSKRGKTWVALNHLHAHLTLVRHERARFAEGLKDERTKARFEATRRYCRVDPTVNPYEHCEIVEYTVNEAGVRGVAS